jgi:hypothetical protein
VTSPAQLLRAWIGPDAWLDQALAATAAGDGTALALAVGQAGRRLGRAALAVDATAAEVARPGWCPAGWSRDQAARACLALAIPANDAAAWQAQLERLFRNATVEEAVALYQALPLYPHPELLAGRAAEGVRSSMTPVFAAVALDNPYPAERLPEDAFRQLVLKCFFVGADSRRIRGLDGRRDGELGRMLAHYARERRIAKRPVDPALPPLARACGADCHD